MHHKVHKIIVAISKQHPSLPSQHLLYLFVSTRRQYIFFKIKPTPNSQQWISHRHEKGRDACTFFVETEAIVFFHVEIVSMEKCRLSGHSFAVGIHESQPARYARTSGLANVYETQRKIEGKIRVTKSSCRVVWSGCSRSSSRRTDGVMAEEI